MFMEEVNEEHKKEILETANKVASGEYEVSWENNSVGIPKLLKKKTEIEKGKKAKKSGTDFELKVRKDLEEKGWTVSKWQNNVDMGSKKVVPAKRVFNPFRKVMTIGTGFPDFIAFQLIGEKTYNVIGVESKLNGLLSREEKEKCAFLLDSKVFNEIWISTKNDKGKVEYLNFKERFPKFT
ncbi:Uncharacterised protein [uncultured archaeon]|nr:Uncharacterised protein [uncultured archaeon]